jgi:hypothetical protein
MAACVCFIRACTCRTREDSTFSGVLPGSPLLDSTPLTSFGVVVSRKRSMMRRRGISEELERTIK